MNSLIKRLPLFAFMLAAFAAFAFTSPEEAQTDVYGFDGEHWYLVNQPPGPGTYNCVMDTAPGCLYEEIDGDPIDPNTNRKFQNNGLTPIEN